MAFPDLSYSADTFNVRILFVTRLMMIKDFQE